MSSLLRIAFYLKSAFIKQPERKRSLSVIIRISERIIRRQTVYEMDRKLKKEIERLLTNCPEGCKCRQQGVEDLCYVRDVGLETFARCLEENSLDCFHRIIFGRANYCSCPPRVSIAKQFEI